MTTSNAAFAKKAEEMLKEDILKSLKEYSNWEPESAKKAFANYLKEMCKAARCELKTLNTARTFIYTDGYYGPISDEQWKEDGRPMTRKRAVAIIKAALEVSFPDIEYVHPELEYYDIHHKCGGEIKISDDTDNPYCEKCGMTDVELEIESLPNCMIDGVDVKKEYWWFLSKIYGALVVR